MEVDSVNLITEDMVVGDNEEGKIKELEGVINKIMIDHEKVVAELTKRVEIKDKENEMLKKKVEKLVKDDGVRKAELNKVKLENEKICAEIGLLQFDKDKVEAQFKAKDKLSKIK